MRFDWRATHDKGNIASSEISLDIRQALIEKCVVPKIRTGEVGDGGEINDQWQTKQVRQLRCNVYGMIIYSAL